MRFTLELYTPANPLIQADVQVKTTDMVTKQSNYGGDVSGCICINPRHPNWAC